MAPYIISFLLSVFLMYIAEKEEKNKYIQYFLVILSLLIPCLLAGLRNIEIGTDVKVYVKPLFDIAENSGNITEYFDGRWWEIWHYKYVKDFEIGFSLLVYFVCKAFSNINVLLFIIEALCIIPFYFGIEKLKELKGKKWLALLTYYFLMFNISLNAMRQFISLSISFYAVCTLLSNKEKKIKPYLINCVACLFHDSAIINFLILVFINVYNLQKYNENKHDIRCKLNLKKTILFIILILAVILLLDNKLLINILNIINLNKYNNYISGEMNFLISKILIKIPIFICIFNCNKSIKEIKYYSVLIVILIFEMLISNYASFTPYAIRISFIFQMFQIILLPILCTCSKKRSIRILNKIMILLYLVVLWYYQFVVAGAHQTIPYTFIFQ